MPALIGPVEGRNETVPGIFPGTVSLFRITAIATLYYESGLKRPFSASLELIYCIKCNVSCVSLLKGLNLLYSVQCTGKPVATKLTEKRYCTSEI
ncbi:hypothetical protein PghCCS26_48320 [Paenibacillus glycanilyticus]|uniref:Uncharacterized protein n=1 Tax=Paenibacillus glycanilyticus TaxID=126569 RepID=A0ABQ6NU77_9BACL|nr:hypothetical protein PghCCS26_48320 [Paenibacillus glycanilyticus]